MRLSACPSLLAASALLSSARTQFTAPCDVLAQILGISCCSNPPTAWFAPKRMSPKLTSILTMNSCRLEDKLSSRG